ncbi:hypothetical protein AMECASPLE_004541 [Ameca splendens]|uniref:Uncharacterized protein n=1 Tax=Ameca splendens TaxID=208324 RepID=A0ABV0XYQ7_9TELE
MSRQHVVLCYKKKKKKKKLGKAFYCRQNRPHKSHFTCRDNFPHHPSHWDKLLSIQPVASIAEGIAPVLSRQIERRNVTKFNNANSPKSTALICNKMSIP